VKLARASAISRRCGLKSRCCTRRWMQLDAAVEDKRMGKDLLERGSKKRVALIPLNKIRALKLFC
jgi:hypothetical protein